MPVTTVQIISFVCHGSYIFEDKHDEICLAGLHDNGLYPPEIRQGRAPISVCSSISDKPRVDEFSSIRKSWECNSQQFMHGAECPQLIARSSGMFSGFEINTKSTVIFP